MYGVSVVAIRFNNEEKVPFCTIGGFDAIHWNLCRGDKEKIRELNKIIIEDTDKDDLISFDRLMLAPCDVVVVVTGEDTYEKLDHTPTDCSKGSLNEGLSLLDYLYGKVELKTTGTKTGH